MVGGALTHLELRFPAPGSIDIKALPSEQASIDRPCPRAEHRHTNGEDRQEDVNPRILAPRAVNRERDPDFVDGNQHSHDGCPKSGKQKDPACGGNQFLGDGSCFRRIRETGNPEIEQSDAEAKPKQEQANAGPAIRKH